MAFTRAAVPNPNYVGAEVWKWTGGGASDIGDPVLINYKADITVMWLAATGTGTLSLLGTIDPAGTLGAVLHDTRGPATGDLTALAMATTPAIRQVLEAPYKIWPVVSATGTPTGVEVWLIIRGR